LFAQADDAAGLADRKKFAIPPKVRLAMWQVVARQSATQAIQVITDQEGPTGSGKSLNRIGRISFTGQTAFQV
jgi:hypothetical protein